MIFFVDKIDFYIEALSIDSTDINLWIKTARRAFMDFDDYVLARNCPEFAFELNKKNWLIIDLLIDCYYILFDYDNCVKICKHALKLDESYIKSQVILNEFKINKVTKFVIIDDIDNVIINNELLINKTKILERLEDRRLKRSIKIEEDKLKCIEIEKNNCIELKINLKTDTLNQFGINLIKLYSDLKLRDLSIDTKVNIIKTNEFIELITTNSLPSMNEENSAQSNSDDANRTKSNLNQTSNQNSSSKDDYSNQHIKSSSQNNSSFPFEYVDKRRSSRVQSIQNKNTKDLDDAALFERITSLFNELCSSSCGSSSNENKNVMCKKNKSKLPVDNVQERECFNQFIKQLDQLAIPTVLNIFQLFLYFNSTHLKRIPLPTIYKDIIIHYLVHRFHF